MHQDNIHIDSIQNLPVYGNLFDKCPVLLHSHIQENMDYSSHLLHRSTTIPSIGDVIRIESSLPG